MCGMFSPDPFWSQDFDRTSLTCTRLKPHAIPYVQVLEDTRKRTNDEYMESANEESSFSAVCFCSYKQRPRTERLFVSFWFSSDQNNFFSVNMLYLALKEGPSNSDIVAASVECSVQKRSSMFSMTNH
ncbi:uncharacterized protein LOC143212163 isoform X1 [Lasioglossum baleicum]|uniref:uncharacterized protein LOC143212163 isoform X1 n=1 Tax=Lasioglossum baleicum TaxID=434251 RepID=UPI003FCCCE2E